MSPIYSGMTNSSLWSRIDTSVAREFGQSSVPHISLEFEWEIGLLVTDLGFDVRVHNPSYMFPVTPHMFGKLNYNFPNSGVIWPNSAHIWVDVRARCEDGPGSFHLPALDLILHFCYLIRPYDYRGSRDS